MNSILHESEKLKQQALKGMKYILRESEKLKQQALKGYARSEKESAKFAKGSSIEVKDYDAYFNLNGSSVDIMRDYKSKWSVYINNKETQCEFETKQKAFDWIINQIEELQITVGLTCKE